ncbi:N-6 DNA methylase [Nodularia spumigena CS-591/12]|uniref:N-6 DNA methylase n=1 Tax=Nodularia spumigena TaxID=70799 RepID=UPI00232DCE7D|nr:N-6 DNA methylase [Nodularia spumigena]MDB9303119.1 N-6 DNA methylase [Nodularia spumigena CS-591/12]
MTTTIEYLAWRSHHHEQTPKPQISDDMMINKLPKASGNIQVSTFEEFRDDFFRIFSNENFYAGKTYLEYIADPQSNDEDNIVDTKIVLPILIALGFDSGDIAKNTTANGKDSSRPDFEVKLASGNIRCFLVEDKNTAYNIKKSEPLQQLRGYATSRGYELGLVCNGKLLLGWDLSNPSSPNPVLHLDIQSIIETYQTGVQNLNFEQISDLKSLYRRFNQQNFENIEKKIQDLSKPENEWFNCAKSQDNTSDFDELLIEGLKEAINILEEDVLYQLSLSLEEYDQYCQSKYLTKATDKLNNGTASNETITETLEKLRNKIQNYLRVYGVLDVEEFSDAVVKLIEFADKPQGSIKELEKLFLDKLIKAQAKKQAQKKELFNNHEGGVQLDLIPNISESKQEELGIKVAQENQIKKLDPKLVELLQEYERIIFDWKAWQAKQDLTHANAIKTHQYFISWRNLVSKTILQGADENKLKAEFSRQTAYVYVIRLLIVRICEDKKLINRKFSNGGFKYWKEEVEPRYLDLAQGMSMDYLLEMSYRSAQNIYAHFFNSADLFNWYRINSNTLIKILHILNRFNLQQIDSDIIGMVYGRYVEEGKHEQGRYFTPKPVVEYILDCIGYKSDNPDIRDKKLLDPAGGSGSFLVHAARRLIDSYRSPRTNKIPDGNIPVIIQQVKDCLFCLDINPFACYLAETNLLIQVIDLLKQAKEANKLQECTIDRFNVYNTDSLLLPKSQEIRTTLLNPILDLELSTVAQIKTQTGMFADGFYFVVANPPYVKADEPGVDIYRREIENSGRFETLHEKWDLFVPFVELACKATKDVGKIGLIVSRGIQTNNYAELLREYIAENLSINQVDFFNNVRIFSDAVVNNTIVFLEKSTPESNCQVKRVLHSGEFSDIQEIEPLNQSECKGKVFRQFVMNDSFEDVTDLEDICYCSKAMVLHSEAKQFKKEDLISEVESSIHIYKYLDGENLVREFSVDKIRYLEWGTSRVPDKISRATIPELYNYPKILFGMTSFPTYDRGISEGDGFYVPDSVRICVRWDTVYGIKRLESERRQMYELSKKRQKLIGDGKGKKIQIYQYAEDKIKISEKFDLRYITAILASSFGKRFLLSNNRDENIMSVNSQTQIAKSRIYPDDLKEFPIKNLSLAKQKPFIERVNNLVAWNWDLYTLMQLGHRINKFDYSDDEPTIEVNVLVIFQNLDLPCWNFLNAEPQRFEVIGERDQPITRIKLKDDKILNGSKDLLTSDSQLVLKFLENYLKQYEKQGLTWTDLLSVGKIPKTDESINTIFEECTRLKTEIIQKISNIRKTYRELDEMVNKLYKLD